MNHPPYGTPPRTDWDLILAALFFLAACLIVSLVLPHWHASADTARHAADEHGASARPAPLVLVTTPEQKRLALAAYRRGTQSLRDGAYPAAADAFKKALEKFPGFAEAYIGLGEASQRLGENQPAALNAQHALDQLAADPAALASGLEIEAVRAWAHRVLGTALLEQAEAALGQHDALLGKMNARRAGFHCEQAFSLDRRDGSARACADGAAALAHTPANG